MTKSRFLDRKTPPHIATLILMAGLSALTMNIFLPSLPGMAAWFDVPYALMQLSVALYLALSAVLQVIIGPVSDRFGRRKVLLAALGLFLIATAGTLLAPTATIFLVFRMAQAVVAAGMVLSRAVVPMIGPVIGGVLDEAFGWQANFGLLAVLGVVVLALVWADLGETATLRKVTLGDQLRSYPGLLTSQRFWGYLGNGRPHLHGVLRLSRRLVVRLPGPVRRLTDDVQRALRRQRARDARGGPGEPPAPGPLLPARPARRRAAQGTDAAQPAATLAVCAWATGDGAAARVAVVRALEADPSCSLALLVEEALDRGLRPTVWTESIGALSDEEILGGARRGQERSPA